MPVGAVAAGAWECCTLIPCMCQCTPLKPKQARQRPYSISRTLEEVERQVGGHPGQEDAPEGEGRRVGAQPAQRAQHGRRALGIGARRHLRQRVHHALEGQRHRYVDHAPQQDEEEASTQPAWGGARAGGPLPAGLASLRTCCSLAWPAVQACSQPTSPGPATPNCPPPCQQGPTHLICRPQVSGHTYLSTP